MLLLLHKKAGHPEIGVCLVNCRPQVYQRLAKAGRTRLFRVTPERDAALDRR